MKINERIIKCVANLLQNTCYVCDMLEYYLSTIHVKDTQIIL